MLNPNQKLNPKVFNDDVEQVPIRKGFGEGLVLAGDENKNIVALCADLTESTQMLKFREKYPDRFVEIGVAEQNLVTVASGLSAVGKIPFCSSYAMFSPGRNWEQIRTTIAYNDRPVVVVGSHAGISVGPDGGTHQAIEDIAIMRVMPNMMVISPCDTIQAKKATIELSRAQKPAYLRLAREKTGVITTDETPFEIGKAQVLWQGDGMCHVGIIGTGAVLRNALLAAKDLERSGVKVKILNIHTIKPIDKEAILKLAKETGKIITIEEHQVAGGLGSAVSEVLSQELPTKMIMLGVQDKFGQSGTPEELIRHYGIAREDVVMAVKKILS